MDTRLETLEQLYRRAGPMILRYLRRNLADNAAAEELVQEMFVVAARDYQALAAARSQQAWLIGIARNLLRSHRRRARLRLTMPLEHDPPAREEDVEDPRLQEMKIAIDRLPDAQREALQLRLAEGLSYAEIAEALNVPIGTVRSRIHNAVAALRTWAVALKE